MYAFTLPVTKVTCSRSERNEPHLQDCPKISYPGGEARHIPSGHLVVMSTWIAGKSLQLTAMLFQVPRNALPIEMICSNPIQDPGSALPISRSPLLTSKFPILLQTAFEA